MPPLQPVPAAAEEKVDETDTEEAEADYLRARQSKFEIHRPKTIVDCCHLAVEAEEAEAPCA